ncbi:PPIC-type PPIASE domain-containing protein [Micromonospora pallida]|uniref:PPIC-type PPIASE domain-containing protein n=1 Tax=Micromonospora pallida TaxID=145854 RepID=A0A1C6T6H7_9ACTN|nr:peptidyl-prolyl cis-trans isomerase [Micromonospora pallida]SCL37368.1 PPIC-type PPIASE domain-containing protein [Micromonospora pallida]
MKRLLLTVSFVALALLASGCGSTDQSVDPPPNVLATVADEPVTVEQVQALIPDSPLPAVLVAGGYSGPWPEALELAIRDELLGREAARRGISGSTRAQQIATLITQEQRDAAGLTAESIADEEAQAWYQEHRRVFGNVAQADVAWGEFSDAAQAKMALEQAIDTDQPTFQRMVREGGAKVSDTATIDDHGEGADPMISRAAFAVGAAGGVGLSADPANNRWWVVRVERISFKQLNWDATLAYKVKSAMATYRQEEHLRRLAQSLRKKWPVHVYETRLADIAATEEPPK